MSENEEDADCDEQWEAGYAECYLEWNKVPRHPRLRSCRDVHECAAMYVSESCKELR